MLTDIDIDAIVSQIEYRDWKINVYHGKRPYLQVEFMAADSNLTAYGATEAVAAFGGDVSPTVQKSRKWWLSYHMCENEIVRTAYKAIKTAIEHELDEHFTFCGQKIFNPHMNYRKLAFNMHRIGENIRE